MFIQRCGINRPMTAISYTDEDARDWVVRSLRREAETVARQDLADSGLRRCDLARRKLARDIGIAPGTVETIARRRRKSLPGEIRDLIHRHMIRWLSAEHSRLAHELSLADRGFSRATARDLQEARAALEEAQKILSEAKQ